jgi:uncharacterized membrane protein
MAKASQRIKPNVRTDKQGLLRDGPNWPLFILALIGMGLTAYLTYTAWQGKLVAGCTEGSACDVVLNSRWSTLLGMPTSFWGFLTYALLAAIAWNKYADTVEVRLVRHHCWTLLQFIPYRHLVFRVAGRLPLLPDFAWVDVGDFYHPAFAKAR